MSDNKLNPVVILHMTATGLAIARSLGKRGVPVYGVDNHKFEIGHKSKYVKSSELSYISYKDKSLVNRLIDFAKKYSEKKPVLYFAGDEYLFSLIDHIDILNRYYILPECYRNGSAKTCLNKKSFYNQCNHLNLDIPATIYLNKNSSIDQILQQIKLPVLLKPVFGHKWKAILAGKKVFIIYNAAQLNRLFATFKDEIKHFMLQELIPGKDDSIYQLSVFIDDNGIVREVMCSRKIRQHPNKFGIGSYITTTWRDDLVRIGLDDLAKLGFKGICDIEYKFDARYDHWRLIEINPRVGMYFALCEYAGLNLVWNSYCYFIDRKDLMEKSGRQKDGLSWQYLARDIPAIFQKILNKDIKWTDIVNLINFHRKVEPILSFEDITCSVYYPFYIIQKSFQFSN